MFVRARAALDRLDEYTGLARPRPQGYAPAPEPVPPTIPPNGITPSLAKFDLRCVVTCVDYGDFLAHTLPHNRVLFDKMAVVTTPEDKATQRVCEYWNVECVTTDAFHARGEFCKGAGINAGLKALGALDWVLHMDADILLPPLARKMIEAARPDPAFIFGVDRVNVPDFPAWARYLGSPALQHECGVFVHPGPFPVATRVARPSEGYIPIGFFQLWNARVSGVTVYPEEHTTAARGMRSSR